MIMSILMLKKEIITIQELGKFHHKVNVIPNGSEKYMTFSINTMLNFIDSFQVLSSLKLR